MKEKTEKIRQILAINIKKRRENLGFSQEKLAELANLSVQAINTIEGCRMWISDKSISRIAKALNVEIFQLFVPYHENKRELTVSPSGSLLEMRQNILNDASIFCENIDNRIKEALKSSLELYKDKEPIEKKPSREKSGRIR